VWRAVLSGLKPGAKFEYRVSRAGEKVFESSGMARKAPDQPVKFIAWGDCAANTPGQRAIAAQALNLAPDFVFIAGDIVYSRGRIQEYRDKYFPIYNSAETPLIRSTLFIGAPGNHDLANRDLAVNPDTLAYYYYWTQPLNGPMHSAFERITGPEATQAALREGAGPNFPRMGSFSFDYGNAHWLVLDSNGYADWTEPALKKWIADDLANAKNAVWKFVGYHHPGFNSSKAHFDEQLMRKLSATFEQGGVDVVIAGHVHNYQRSWPLTFTEDPSIPPPMPRRVPGKWTLDKTYDGKKNTRPKGVIYLVTGAGGAGLYNPDQGDDPESWMGFTNRFVSKVHSLTVAEINGHTAKFRQVSATGEEVDAFTITK
jgi:predicted phosphodiesterase